MSPYPMAPFLPVTGCTGVGQDRHRLFPKLIASSCIERPMTENSSGNVWFVSLKKLIDDLSKTSIEEFRVRSGRTRILIRRNGRCSSPPAEQGSNGSRLAESLNSLQICAPLTGILYLTPSPSAPPFAREGDLVEAGQVVALIEAMKVFNEVRAESSGRVLRIVAQNGQLVQKGQPILEMEKE